MTDVDVQGRDAAGLHVQVEVRPAGAGGGGLLSPVLGRDGLHQRGAGQQALQGPQAHIHRRRSGRSDAWNNLQDDGHPA